VLTDTNLLDERQRVRFQSAVHDNHLERHVTDKNTVPQYSPLLDMTLVLTVGFSFFELAVELLRIEA
jgi:hypothetical protein